MQYKLFFLTLSFVVLTNIQINANKRSCSGRDSKNKHLSPPAKQKPVIRINPTSPKTRTTIRNKTNAACIECQTHVTKNNPLFSLANIFSCDCLADKFACCKDDCVLEYLSQNKVCPFCKETLLVSHKLHVSKAENKTILEQSATSGLEIVFDKCDSHFATTFLKDLDKNTKNLIVTIDFYEAAMKNIPYKILSDFENLSELNFSWNNLVLEVQNKNLISDIFDKIPQLKRIFVRNIDEENRFFERCFNQPE